MRLILASTSPRRQEIVALLGIPFQVIAPDFAERVAPERAIEEEVLGFAVGKARSVARRNPQSIVIGSDTMIFLNGAKIGKPTDRDDAKQILRALSGKTHRICTSVAILDGLGGPGLRRVDEVVVKMRDYTAAEIAHYLSSNESLDKAGGYSIQGQGRGLIECMRGDYLAAVGLPLKPIAEYLVGQGITVRFDVDRLYAEKSFLNWRSFDE
jgi:septum formation protein